MQATGIQLPIEGLIEQVRDIQGIDEDCWVGQQFSLSVTSDYPTVEIQLRGYIPDLFKGENLITLRVGEITQQITAFGNQDFQMTLPVQIAAAEEIKMIGYCKKTFNPKRQGLGADERDLSFLLIELQVKRGKSAGEYLKEGKLLEIQGSFAAAIQFYQQAIALQPTFAWAYYCMGEVLSKQSRTAEATTWYNKANQLDLKLTRCYSSSSEANLTEQEVYETNHPYSSPHL